MAFFADYYNLVTFWETEEFFFGHATHFKENDCVYRYCHDEGDQGCDSSSDEGVKYEMHCPCQNCHNSSGDRRNNKSLTALLKISTCFTDIID